MKLENRSQKRRLEILYPDLSKLLELIRACVLPDFSLSVLHLGGNISFSRENPLYIPYLISFPRVTLRETDECAQMGRENDTNG